MNDKVIAAEMDGRPAALPSPLAAPVARLFGAPLDFIKTAAAAFMVLDHYNTIILNRAEVWLFRFGRIAFPLFCFAVACHVIRDREHRGKSLSLLLVFAVVTQPFYSWAFGSVFGNVLFTLAAAGAVAAFLPTLHPLLRHAILAVALAACWFIPSFANTAADYGVAGMVFPATIVLTAIAGLDYLPWAIAFGATLNAFPHSDAEGWWVEPLIDALFALGGAALVVAASTRLIGQPRFLPRYALHVFYPGHIGLLAALRWLLLVLPH
jgi:TraX protein